MLQQPLIADGGGATRSRASLRFLYNKTAPLKRDIPIPKVRNVYMPAVALKTSASVAYRGKIKAPSVLTMAAPKRYKVCMRCIIGLKFLATKLKKIRCQFSFNLQISLLLLCRAQKDRAPAQLLPILSRKTC